MKILSYSNRRIERQTYKQYEECDDSVSRNSLHLVSLIKPILSSTKCNRGAKYLY